MAMADDFDFSVWEDQFPDVDSLDTSDVVDVTSLTTPELLDRFHTLTDKISERGELLRPTTPEGRELHSHRAAARVELAKRGLL